jgi:hypothetical protein
LATAVFLHRPFGVPFLEVNFVDGFTIFFGAGFLVTIFLGAVFLIAVLFVAVLSCTTTRTVVTFEAIGLVVVVVDTEVATGFGATVEVVEFVVATVVTGALVEVVTGAVVVVVTHETIGAATITGATLDDVGATIGAKVSGAVGDGAAGLVAVGVTLVAVPLAAGSSPLLMATTTWAKLVGFPLNRDVQPGTS